MSDMKLEIEFKYDAKNISLEAFEKFAKLKKPQTTLSRSGTDYFYYDSTKNDTFLRYRAGESTNQLTFKRKKSLNNSFIRTEHNIDLNTVTTLSDITALCRDLGYVYNTSIFKTSFIYTYEWYNLAYYICYDASMHEVGRFVELEMSEVHPWTSESEAWNELLVLEKICKPLGLAPSKRINESLFEMYKKETVTND